MLEEASDSLNNQIKSILARSTPLEERPNLEHILSNVYRFINLVRRNENTEQRETYLSIPLFIHYLLLREAADAADAFQRRLDIIDRYKIADVQQIINIIVSSRFTPQKEKMTHRRSVLLLELFRNPHLRQYQLAKSLSSTQRIVGYELKILRRDFTFRKFNYINPHRFKLAQQMVVFRTKSLEASDQLEQYFRSSRPTFFHTLSFDQDFRHGYLTYYVPDQPKGHRIFEDRMHEYRDDYFEEYYCLRLTGIQGNISFNGFNPDTDTWTMEADFESESDFTLTERQQQFSLEQTKLMYSCPMHFDKIDYLLGQTSFVATGTRSFEFKRGVLQQFGFELSNKAIWKREKRLKDAEVFLPVVYYEIPQFEELVMLAIQCSAKAQEAVKCYLSILPYSLGYPTDSGLVIFFQRPTGCSAITRQLISAISNQPDVSNVDVLRLEASIGSSMVLNAADRWDASHQRWILQTGDM